MAEAMLLLLQKSLSVYYVCTTPHEAAAGVCVCILKPAAKIAASGRDGEEA